MQKIHIRLGHDEGSGGFRHREETNGSADSHALASAAADGRLAVVTRGKKRRQCLHLYTLQVCLGLILERSRAAFRHINLTHGAVHVCTISEALLAGLVRHLPKEWHANQRHVEICT